MTGGARRHILAEPGQPGLHDAVERGAQGGVGEFFAGEIAFRATLSQGGLPGSGFIQRGLVARESDRVIGFDRIEFGLGGNAGFGKVDHSIPVFGGFAQNGLGFPHRVRFLDDHAVILAFQRQAERGARLGERRHGLLQAQLVVARFDLGEDVALAYHAPNIHDESLQTARQLGAERGLFPGCERARDRDRPCHGPQFRLSHLYQSGLCVGSRRRFERARLSTGNEQ